MPAGGAGSWLPAIQIQSIALVIACRVARSSSGSRPAASSSWKLSPRQITRVGP
jgi:hypothetical protein